METWFDRSMMCINQRPASTPPSAAPLHVAVQVASRPSKKNRRWSPSAPDPSQSAKKASCSWKEMAEVCPLDILFGRSVVRINQRPASPPPNAAPCHVAVQVASRPPEKQRSIAKRARTEPVCRKSLLLLSRGGRIAPGRCAAVRLSIRAADC